MVETSFTGKERDAESGLDNFGARYNASSLGRFMTPDWAAKPTTVPYASFGDPQTLNLYTYVENAPLNRIDPDGHILCGPSCDPWTGKNKSHSGPEEIEQDNEAQYAEAQNTDPTAPPPPPTPDPAGTRTDPALNPSNSNSSTTNTPADQTQAPMESRAHGKGERNRTGTTDETKGAKPIMDNGKVTGWRLPTPDGKGRDKTLEWGRVRGLNPKDFGTAKKVGFWGGVAAGGAALIRALGPFFEWAE